MNQWNEAAEDGRQCIIVDKSFVKGYFRHALALQNMGNLDGASDSVKRGLGIDSTNADLKKMSRELDESMRVKKVEQCIVAAEQQESSGDIVSAFKTVDSALRLDPTNDSLKRMMDRIKPKYERAEKVITITIAAAIIIITTTVTTATTVTATAYYLLLSLLLLLPLILLSLSELLF